MLGKVESLILYLFVFIVSAMLVSESCNKKRSIEARKICMFLACVFPLVLSGFRACGTDIHTYAKQYGRALNSTIKWFWEKGGSLEVAFKLIAKAARKLGNIRILFTVCSGITLIPVYRSITEKQRTLYTGYAAMAFLFMFFPGSWNVIRQYMAVGIVCYAYKFIFTKEFKKYILCIIAAGMCHETALIMIPVYFLWSKDGDLVSRGKIWAACIILIIVSINLSFVLSGHLGGSLERYENYLNGHGSGKNRDLFLNIFETLIILYFMKALSGIDKRNKLYFLMLIFQCIIGITGFKSPYIKRIGFYFGITEIFLVGALPRAVKRTVKNKRLSRTLRVMIVVYILAKFWFVDYYLNQPKIMPYKWKFPEGLF